MKGSIFLKKWASTWALCVLTCGGVYGQFLGIEAELTSTSEVGNTYRIYATFGTSTDNVVAVFGGANYPLILESSEAFFQSSFGGDFASDINTTFFDSYTNLEFDSWLAIGSDNTTGTSEITHIGLDAGLASFNEGAGMTIDSPEGGTWFVFPNSSADASAGENGKVLLAQLTTAGIASWALNLQWHEADGTPHDEEGLYVEFPDSETIGCTDSVACNYNPEAIADDGSCDFCSCNMRESLAPYTLTVESSPAITAGYTRYRFYIDMQSATDRMSAIYGNNMDPLLIESTTEIYNSEYNSSWNASGLSPMFMELFPEMADDSYATIGLLGPAAEAVGSNPSDPALAEDVLQSPTISAFFTSGGTTLSVNTVTGGVWYILNTATNGLPDENMRVLCMQITTEGTISGVLNAQIFADGVGENEVKVTWQFNGAGVFQSDEASNSCGCTDETALNYDADVDYDDGSCIGVVEGCSDASACNFDGAVNVDDDSCTYPEMGYGCDGECLGDEDGDEICDANEVPGCTDEGATNFDPTATDDNGSCTYSGCTDSEADNYNPIASIDDASCFYLGCTDPNAMNPNPTATLDDGSCEYPSPSFVGLVVEEVATDLPNAGLFTHRLYAQFDNPFDQLIAIYALSGSPLELNVGTTLYQNTSGNTFAPNISPGAETVDPNVAYDSWFTIGGDAPGSVFITSIGLTDALNEFDAGNGFYLNNFTGGMWFIIPDTEPLAFPDAQGRVLIGQFTSSGLVSVNLNLQYKAQNGEGVQEESLSISFPDLPSGCLDAMACNFASGAVVEDGSCDYTTCLGCTDPMACNFNPESTQDDGTCSFPTSPYDCTGACVLDGDGDGVCDELEISGCTNESATNFSPEATEDDGLCIIEGCTIPQAENYDPEANEDDGSCVVRGCTDPNALNPDPIANEDDGSCEYPDPSYLGISWEHDGNTPSGTPIYRVYANFSNNFDQMIAVYSLAESHLNISTTSWFEQSEYGAALASGLLNQTLGENDSWLSLGGESSSEISLLQVGLEEAIASFEGGGNFILDDENGGAWFVIPGTEPATFPDETGRVLLAQLITPGQVSLSINLQYRAQDGSSIQHENENLIFPEGVAGCTSNTACNYNSAAAYDDGNCEFPEQYYNCDGICNSDIDGDGLCDESEIAGCTDIEADNYNPDATDDDGSCVFFGCTNPDADNFSSSANTDDGSCIVSGCTYSFSTNYNPDATYDDGSCTVSPFEYCGDGTIWDDESGACIQEIEAYLNDEDELSLLNPCYFDSDEDGIVDITDLMNLLTVYGTSCP